MTEENFYRGKHLLEDIERYEKRLEIVQYGEIYARDDDGNETHLEEDIFREIILAQLNKDLNFLKERFEQL